MRNMFSGCCNLKNLNLLSFDTKKVTNMSFMFQNLGNKELNLDLSTFNVKYVTELNHMFQTSFPHL